MEMLRDDGLKESLLKSVFLKIKWKSDTKRARRRIVEEQHGEKWPPFAASFVVA